MFQKGPDPNRNTKGRPIGGRSKAIGLVDKICSKAKNLKAMEKDLQAKFDASPVWFFMNIVMPLAPKQKDTGLVSIGFATMTPADAADAMDQATIGDQPARPTLGDQPNE